MIKLEDEETNEVHYTNLVCELLDVQSCRCTNYSFRDELQRTVFVFQRAI